MGKLQIPKKIRIEDFASDYKELIEKISFVFNPFTDEVYQALNGNIDTSNLNRQIVDVSVQIDGSGKVVGQPQIKTTVSGKISGIVVINATNLVNPTTYPTNTPFVSYTTSGNILTILNITGLQNNSQYKLVLEIIV
jgi:uncharacterized protein YuzE